MAILNIVEIGRVAPLQAGNQIPVRGIGGTSQDVDFTGGETQSSAVGARVGVVRLCADTDCRIAIGDNPTATSTSARLPADAIEYIGIKDGQKVSVVAE